MKWLVRRMGWTGVGLSRRACIIFCLWVGVVGCDRSAQTAQVSPVARARDLQLDSLDKKMSYVFGRDMARRANVMGVVLDVEVLLLGVQDTLTDAEPRLSDDQMHAVLMAYKAEQKEIIYVKQHSLARANAQAEQAYLADNMQVKDVRETSSGLQYKVLSEGSGESPESRDEVLVRYVGRNLNGHIFDQSGDSPARFSLLDVIPAWREALPQMSVGAIWELYVPAVLAYGIDGKLDYRTGSYIVEPNAAIIFEVELLDIVRAQ